LKHCIDYSMNMVEINDYLIAAKHLPKYIQDNSTNKKIHNLVEVNKSKNNLKKTLEEIERNIIIGEIKSSRGNFSRAAKNLNISRQNLQYRLKVLNILEHEY